MNSQIDNAIKRARGYWFVDGFTEIIAGVFFILLAGLLFFSLGTSQASFPSWFLSTAVEISIAKLAGIVTAVLILWWLKDHFTYPRTGFVRGKHITATQVLITVRNTILFLLLPILSLVAASLLLASPAGVLSSMPAWFPMGVSLIWACLFVAAAKWIGLRRFHVLAGTILLTGIAIGIWQLTTGLPGMPAHLQPGILQPAILESINRTLTGLSYLVLGSGIILIFSGVLTFLRYRKENPHPYAENL